MSLYRQQKSSKKFSERFRQRLGYLGLQQNEVAERLGVETTSVSNWINGYNMPKPQHLRAFRPDLFFAHQILPSYLRAMLTARVGQNPSM